MLVKADCSMTLMVIVFGLRLKAILNAQISAAD